MRHAPSMLVLAMAVTATAWFAAERPSVPAPADSAPIVELSCKPEGPVSLELDALPTSGGGVPVEFRLNPIMPCRSLAWSWELSPELAVLDGARQGLAATVRGQVTDGRLVVAPPPDGRHAELRLVVSGVFTGSDETGATFDEPFHFERAVRWGQTPIPVPVVQSPDESGALVDVAVVPSSHTAGR